MRIHSPYPASWALAQRIGYLYSEGEIIYLADTPFERLLDIQRQVGQCQTMTSLSQADFEARLEAVFHQNTGESQQIAQDIDQSVDLLSLSEEMPANEDLLNEDSAAPVIRLINAILSEAIKETASDIHIETYEKTMSIRFRIDGVLRTILQPNKKLAALLISRIKVMARLDIAEKRIPQDGRISLRIGRRNIDVRVSTLPSIYGERAVLRLLDKNSLQLSLNNLGMTAADKQDLENLIQLPHGIILVTGPTGSGKSTTLYAILSALNTPGRNILTVEDPVEYELEGIGQTQVNIQHPEIPSLSLYSADIAFQRYDMLHGIFRKQKTVSKSGKWLARLAVSCLVLAILSFVGSRSIALWHTLKIEDQLQQQQQETWQRYFPQIKRTHNFRFYFKQQLAQQYPEAVPLLYHLQTLLLEHPELQLMEANYSQKQKSLTLKMSAKSEANIDRFCELTQSWLPMEKTEKDPVSGVWTVRNSGK